MIKFFNYFLFLILFPLSTMSFAHSPELHEQDGSMPHKEYKASGIVKSINQREMLIKHKPIKELSWPEMEMVFKISEQISLSELKDIKAGDFIKFMFYEKNDEYIITALREHPIKK